MHLQIDKTDKIIISRDKEWNIKEWMSYRKFKENYNCDLFDVLIKHWEYKTKYHHTTQLDFNL